ncbi:MAG: hypothetical protein ABL986_06615 [Vicinamibacterales bacterium]
MSRAAVTFLERQLPDVLLLTSLTVARSAQIHQLNEARAVGIRSTASILSWDHLSSKALLLTQREDRKRARIEEREALAAQARQARLKDKEQTVAARRQARDAWQATKRRQRQRQQLNSRLADYYKRLTRPFTAHR